MNTQDIKTKIYLLEQELLKLKREVSQKEKEKKYDFIYYASFFIEGVSFIKEINEDGSVSKPYFCDMKDYNYFSSKEIADKWLKKINAFLKLRMIAEHLHGEEWEPNWNNQIEAKWEINCERGCYKISTAWVAQKFPVYFKTKEFAEKAIEMMGEESLKDFFK